MPDSAITFDIAIFPNKKLKTNPKIIAEVKE
jgi:hypothetical protein